MSPASVLFRLYFSTYEEPFNTCAFASTDLKVFLMPVDSLSQTYERCTPTAYWAEFVKVCFDLYNSLVKLSGQLIVVIATLNTQLPFTRRSSAIIESSFTVGGSTLHEDQ